jgi:hypothetical protein
MEALYMAHNLIKSWSPRFGRNHNWGKPFLDVLISMGNVFKNLFLEITVDLLKKHTYILVPFERKKDRKKITNTTCNWREILYEGH